MKAGTTKRRKTWQPHKNFLKNMGRGLKVFDARLRFEGNPEYVVYGPLPSTGYLDDQLGEFLEEAGVDAFIRGLTIEILADTDTGVRVVELAKYNHTPNNLEKLEAAITIVELAHRLGERTEPQAPILG